MKNEKKKMPSNSPPSALEVIKKINKNNLLPIYCFFGEDSGTLNAALKAVEEAVQPLINSDFDREIYFGEDKSLSEILASASAFPFASGKKLIVLKNFDKIGDKKNLKPYAASPADFTVLVLLHNGKITSLKSDPFNLLSEKGFLFSVTELKGSRLIKWAIEYCESKGKQISQENARLLIDIVGENRAMIEAQMEKIFTFVGERNEIEIDDISSLSTSLKEYTIFNLQDALTSKDKAESFKIAYKMLDQGNNISFIIYMLTKYFTGISRVKELIDEKIPDGAASRFIGTHPYFYKNYKIARRNYSDQDLLRISNALVNADLAVKTTSADEKTIVAVLLSEIMKEEKVNRKIDE